MAFIGLRYPVAAPFAQATEGTMPTYTGGMVVGKAIQANLTKTHNNNPLRADDTDAEDDNSLTSMSLQLGVDDLEDTVRAALLGDIAVETGSPAAATGEYDEGANGSNYVGFGYIRVRKRGNTRKYQAIWYWKVLFSEDSEDARTQAENIEWQTPTVTGRAHGCYIDNSGVAKFRRRKTFDTEAEAKTWLNTKAGIANP